MRLTGLRIRLLSSAAVPRPTAAPQTSRRYAPTLLSMVVFCGLLGGHASFAWCERAASTAPDEPVPTLRASDLLVSEVLRGPNYQIDEFVQVEKHKYVFQINTEWGIIPAHGLNMLELRLRELHAVENVRQAAKDPQWVKGIVETVRNSPQGLKILLTEPQGAPLRLSAAADRGPRGKLEPAERRAGSDARRRLAVELGADPETANPILRGLLDGLATRKEAPSAAVKFRLSTTAPGLNLLASTPELKEQVATKPPHEINIQIYHDLEGMGIPQRLCEQFCRDVNYTTSQRLLFVHYLRPLREVKNLPVLVEGAVEASHEADGLAIIQELKLLNELQRRDPIREVTRGKVPLALTQSNTLVAVTSSDYIIHSAELVEAIALFRQNHPKAPSVLYMAGKVSPQAKQDFAAAKIQVQER